MDRRSFLTTSAAAGLAGAASLASPALAQGAASRTLRFVPQANLANFDPIWSTAYVARNAGMLVWDMLYGIDDKFVPQRQMVESEEVSPDGLVWNFRLREGLRFHDGEPVRARDVVASLARWSVRDPMGQGIRAVQQDLVAVDDRAFRWTLKQPYPKLLLALGKTNAPVAFIMPERIAKADPFQQITEYVGSGPMRFLPGEWVPGARAAFQKFDGYVPRAEPARWISGGKRILLDRIEWQIIPDAATAVAALQNGEVDWLETPLADLIPSLRRNRDVSVAIADPLGNVAAFRMNHLYPPFNDVRVRRAVMMALSQEDYMHAVVGSEDDLWKRLPSFFTPGTPLYTEQGGDILKAPRNLDAAKKLLAESGYAGQPVVCLFAQDLPVHKAMGEVTADLLKQMGMNVDYVATDWGTVGARRASKKPPGEGGWNMFHTWHAGADCVNPAGYQALRTNGDGAWFGWPKDDTTEAHITEWFAATSPEQEKAAMGRINQAAMDFVVYAPIGFFQYYQAWRKNLSGVTAGPVPTFWNVTKG